MRSRVGESESAKHKRRFLEGLFGVVASFSLLTTSLVATAVAVTPEEEGQQDQGTVTTQVIEEDQGTNDGESSSEQTANEGELSNQGLDATNEGAVNGLSENLARDTSEAKYLNLTKLVDSVKKKDLDPGDTFTYQYQISVSEKPLTGITLDDILPDLNGFQVVTVRDGDKHTEDGFLADDTSLNFTVQWFDKDDNPYPAAPETLSLGDHFRVVIDDTVYAGNTVTLTLQVRIPESFSPDDPRNGRDKELINKATAAAPNNPETPDVTSEATITVATAVKQGASITKTWLDSNGKAEQGYAPGAQSTIGLKATNGWNVGIDKMVVVDPVEGNPFNNFDFVGFGPLTLPSGADQVQVDVWNGTDWVLGEPLAAPALPGLVTADQVQGLRFTFTNSAGGRIAIGATADISVNVAQRESLRDGSTTDLSLGYTANNKAKVEAYRGDADPATGESSASFKVTPVKVGVGVTKAFDQAELSKGGSTIGTLTVTNESAPVNELTVEDQAGFFDGTVFADGKTWVRQFNGFTAPVLYPESAASGKVVFTFDDATTSEVPFASGDTPVVSAGKTNAQVTGFKFVFNAAEGTNGIGAYKGTEIKFAVNTNASATKDNTSGYTALDQGATFQGWAKDNNAKATATPVGRDGAEATTKAQLKVLDPWIKVTETKKILPSTAVLPGQDAIAELTTTAKASEGTKVTNLTITDEWRPSTSNKCNDARDFWDAFNMTSIRPTQVHEGYTADVQVKLNGSWVTIRTGAPAGFIAMDEAEFATALPAGSAPSDVTGVKFIYNSTDPAGAGKELTVTPYVGFTARTITEGLRTEVGGENCKLPSDPDKNVVTNFKNLALAHGEGQPPYEAEKVTDDAKSEVIGKVVVPGTGGVDPVGGTYLNKKWNQSWVLEQSRNSRSTKLSWGVEEGFKKVVIGDPTGGTIPSVQDSVFNAFNLTGVAAIAASNTPFSNGWYLKYDTISEIEIYNGTSWVVPTNKPAAGWQDADGSFKKLDLTAAEQKSTTGIRITLVPNDDARTAALTSGSDPLAPRPGTGVASGGGTVGAGSPRTFDLNWQLRDKSRTGTPEWVTRDEVFNATAEGLVRNDADLVGTPASGPEVTRKAQDNIQILGTEPAVAVTKTVNPTQIVVPDPDAGIAPADYPTAKYVVTAENTAGQFEGTGSGASLAKWIRVVDPAVPGLDWDTYVAGTNPWTGVVGSLNDALFGHGKVLEPFNWQNVTGLTLSATTNSQIDWATSKVFLLYYKNGAFSTGEGTINASTKVVSPGAGYELSDVVGFALEFQSTSTDNLAAGGGGNISSGNQLKVTVDTQVRDEYRVPADEATSVEAGKTVATDNLVKGQLSRADGKRAIDDSKATLTFLGEKLDVAPAKTITPGTVNEPDRGEPIAVSLKANQGDKNLASSPKSVVLEDYADSKEFWDVVTLESIQSIKFPEGANQVQIDAHQRGGDWVTGTAQASTSTEFALPSGVATKDVDGLRFTFAKTDGTVFNAKNDPTWSAEVKLVFSLNDDVDFPQTGLTNTLSAQSFGVNANSEKKFDDDDLNLSPGTHKLGVGKLSNNGVRQVKGGSTVPWDLVIENVGTGYIDLTTVEDVYPEYLLYTGTRPGGAPAIEFKNLAAGAISEPEVRTETGKVIFDWADAEDSRLRPGERVEIRLWLQLQASAAVRDDNGKLPVVENFVEVYTDNQLADVERLEFYGKNDKPIGKPDNADALGETGGESWDTISITEDLAVQISKGVRGPESGFVSGAVNWNDPSAECPTFVGNDGNSYYPTPCVVNSQQGKSDTWVLRMANVGGVKAFDDFWVFDALSKPDDLKIVSGTSRGSQYRPVLTGAPKIVPNQIMMDDLANEHGTDWTEHVTVSVTTSENQVCKGAWDQVNQGDHHDPNFAGPCTANGEVWYNLVYDDPMDLITGDATFAEGDWEDVTGLRIRYHRDDDDLNEFGVGWVVDAVYNTRNVIKSEPAFPQGAQNVIPVDRDELAWNQFGVSFLAGRDGGADDRLASEDVGTRLLNGSIAIEKLVQGDAAKYAPDTFTATVSCEVPGESGSEPTPLFFADASSETGVSSTKTVELKKNTEGSYDVERIHGIPVGAECTVTEDGATGHFGETTRDPSSVTVEVAQPDTEFDSETGLPTNSVPEDQLALITNTYNWSALSVTKNVVTEADKGTFGPFDFELSCVTSDQSRVDATGKPVTVPVMFPVEGKDPVSKLAFTLEDGETWPAPKNTIPWGSTCTLTETNRDGAASTVITGDNVTDNENGSATIKVTGTEEDPAAVVSTQVDNHYPAGTFTVKKDVTGEGATTYGTGSFNFAATCTYKGKSVLDESFTLKNGDTKTFGTFPEGTVCEVEETTTGGATSTAMSPEDGKITIQGPKASEGEETPAVGSLTATATNTFDVGSLKITKERVGTGAEQYGVGPFEAQVACTYDKDGTKTDIALANDGKVTLSEVNQYTATIGDLIVGAECTVVETDEDGAHSVDLTPEDGKVTIEESEQVVDVTITNTFNTGSLELVKKLEGAGAKDKANVTFEAQVTCEYQVGNETRNVVLPNAGKYQLSKANGYKATVSGIYDGATCTVKETNTGGATKVTMDPKDGKVTVGSDKPVTVTITNHFSELPDTGARVAGAGLAAIALLGLGGGAMLISRRNRNSTSGRHSA
ncbi:MAG: DUF5979 domain-containing protein [Scrofimicrobium sp.]